MPPLSREPLPCVVGRTCVLRRRKIYTEVSRGVVAHDRVTPRESAALFWVGKACFGGGLGGERGACVFQPAPDVWPVWGHERDAWGLVPDAKFVHTRQTQPAPTHVCPNPGAQRERATTTNACVAVQTRRRVLQTPRTTMVVASEGKPPPRQCGVCACVMLCVSSRGGGQESKPWLLPRERVLVVCGRITVVSRWVGGGEHKPQ